ncbi:hypothetical protein BGZ70_002401 [Mortierella alpina]|uniref:Uncharacterized protein n=1 Tax=Mortierella alpina TaxID=64518 RepID=A0A9P6IXD8_MORAP|nr:hypothetical protein BGZ70_002401 [Mortierella alpina]
MLFKTAALAALALAASVSAQTPNHTYFTNPVGDGQIYKAGSTETFSWNLACVPPSTYTAANPSNVSVVLVNSTNTNNAFFLMEVASIDCTNGRCLKSVVESYLSGTVHCVLPEDSTTLFSLKIVLSQDVYSSKFTISGGKAAPAPPTTSNPPASSAKSLVPVLSSVAAAVAAGALYVL